MALFKELVAPAHHVVLIGDSNIAYQREDGLMGPLQDLWPTLNPDGALGATFDLDKNLMGKEASGMSGAYRLDRAFFTSNTLKGEDFRIVGTDPFEPGLWPSDHYGIVVKLSFRLHPASIAQH